MNIARTTLSSKILTGDKDHFATLAVDAIMRLKGGRMTTRRGRRGRRLTAPRRRQQPALRGLLKGRAGGGGGAPLGGPASLEGEGSSGQVS